MIATITCDKCGALLNISPYLNADLQLICDDLAAKLATAEAPNCDLRQLLETACDAWECGIPTVIPQGGCWRHATLNQDWYEKAQELCSES